MDSLKQHDAKFQEAADAVRAADALLIGAGAGMGVDSGLPDFRGTEGFWKAYPPFRGRSFSEISTPHWFETDPALAWGFFGHRLKLYRNAIPHKGFEILRRWCEKPSLGAFVFTSNVDGQFQKSGFADTTIIEYHGSIHHLQCTRNCGQPIWSASDENVQVDESTIRATSELPHRPKCSSIARPNILMFGDWGFDQSRHTMQNLQYQNWLRRVQGRHVVAIEMGAGLAIPTVRHECEIVAHTVIRINPREAETASTGISLPCGALAALEQIDAHLSSYHAV